MQTHLKNNTHKLLLFKRFIFVQFPDFETHLRHIKYAQVYFHFLASFLAGQCSVASNIDNCQLLDSKLGKFVKKYSTGAFLLFHILHFS